MSKICFFAVALIFSVGPGLTEEILPLANITDYIQSQQDVLRRIFEMDPKDQLSKLFPEIRGAEPRILSKCYNQALEGTSLNIFENSPLDIITAYYSAFPENFDINRFREKARNLLSTFTEIATRSIVCMSIPSMQVFQVGLNKLSDFSAAEYSSMMGVGYLSAPKKNDPGQLHRNCPAVAEGDATDQGFGALGDGLSRFNQGTTNIDPKCFPESKNVPASLDYRALGKVTPVRYQGTCGSGWAFAALATIESAYLIQNKTSDTKFDLSEQQLVMCANEYFCKKGTSVDAYNFIMLNNGVTSEERIPYNINTNRSCVTRKMKRVAKIYDYCLRGVDVWIAGKPEYLSDNDIQAIIKKFGSVYSEVNVKTPDFKNYKSGIINIPKCKKSTNHAVNIVGWNEDAWIVKNSWSKKWGEDGYFRLKRGVNMCGINKIICYPIFRE